MPEYKLIRSRRKSISIRVTGDGQVEIRAPFGCPDGQIEKILVRKQEWILRNQMRQRELDRLRRKNALTPEAEAAAREEARRRLKERTAFFAERMGVSYGKITVREQRTRWGSCSSRGNLNFNWKLIRMPREILDYVVVHELAHRKEMNHSRAFYQIVASVLPDYRSRERWLREHGGEY